VRYALTAAAAAAAAAAVEKSYDAYIQTCLHLFMLNIPVICLLNIIYSVALKQCNSNCTQA
jgi:hypothetical protein